MTSLKSVSSMKLHRNLGVTQTTAWITLQRIREELIAILPEEFEGPVEVEEAYFGGLEKNKHEWKKANLGRGQVGKAAVVGMKNRTTGQIKAQVVERTDKATPSDFVDENAAKGT